MPEVSIDLNMVRVTNDDFVKKAEACVRSFQETVIKSRVSIVDVGKTENIYQNVVVKDSLKSFQLPSCQRTSCAWTLESPGWI